MRASGPSRVAMAVAIAGILVFALGEAAWATTGQDGPTPPKVGDPERSDVSPHGGYSSTTNFCMQCHEVHEAPGEYAQNRRQLGTQTVVDWAEGTQIRWKNPTTGQWARKYLHLGASGWEVCDAGNTNCVPAQVKDSEGQLVYLYGYELLSAYPNHTSSQVKGWGVDKYEHDGAKWCGTCHPSRIDVAAGGTYHNHPRGCTACHGNPADGSSADFPHTSTLGEFLINHPDALCITCHTSGSLP